MRLYLVRHGDALSAADDSARSLSPKGLKECEIMGEFLRRNKITVSQVYHSSKERAIQTANILGHHMQIADKNIKALPGLQPEDPVIPIAVYCNQWQEDTMLVGHLPFMARLAAQLMTEHEDIPCVDFQSAAILCVEKIDILRWCLRWFAHPGIC